MMSNRRSTLEKVIGLVSNDFCLLNILFAEARRRYHFVPGQDRTPEAAWSESVCAVVASAFAHDGVVEVLREKLLSVERDNCGVEGPTSSSSKAPTSPKREVAPVMYSAEDVEVGATSGEVPPLSEIAKDTGGDPWAGCGCDTSDGTTSLGTPRQTAGVLVPAINAGQNQPDPQHQSPVTHDILPQTEGNDRRKSSIARIIDSEGCDLRPQETSSACSTEGVGDSKRNDVVSPVFLQPAPCCESRLKGCASGATAMPTCEQHHISHDNNPPTQDVSEPLDGELSVSADTEKVVTQELVLIETNEDHDAVEVEEVKSPVPELTTVCCANRRHGEEGNGSITHGKGENFSEESRVGLETGQALVETVTKSEMRHQVVEGGTLTSDDKDVHLSDELGPTGFDVEASTQVKGLSHQTSQSSSKDSAAVYLARTITSPNDMSEEIPVKGIEMAAPQRGSASSDFSHEETGGAVRRGHTPKGAQPNAEEYENDSFEELVDNEKRVRFVDTDLCKVYQIREKFAPHEIRDLFYSAEDFDSMCDELELEEREEWQQPVAKACEDDTDDSSHTGVAAVAVNDDDTVGSYSCEDISLGSCSFEGDDSNDRF